VYCFVSSRNSIREKNNVGNAMLICNICFSVRVTYLEATRIETSIILKFCCLLFISRILKIFLKVTFPVTYLFYHKALAFSVLE